jgi:hypothetical protein
MDPLLRKNEELSAMLEVSRVLTASFDLEKNLAAAMAIFASHLDMQRGCVFLLDPDSKKLRIVAAHGLSPQAIRRAGSCHSLYPWCLRPCAGSIWCPWAPRMPFGRILIFFSSSPARRQREASIGLYLPTPSDWPGPLWSRPWYATSSAKWVKTASDSMATTIWA